MVKLFQSRLCLLIHFIFLFNSENISFYHFTVQYQIFDFRFFVFMYFNFYCFLLWTIRPCFFKKLDVLKLKLYKNIFFKLCYHPMTVLFWYISFVIFPVFQFPLYIFFKVTFLNFFKAIFRVGVCWFRKHIYVC